MPRRRVRPWHCSWAVKPAIRMVPMHHLAHKYFPRLIRRIHGWQHRSPAGSLLEIRVQEIQL
jgi:hypothetical protein